MDVDGDFAWSRRGGIGQTVVDAEFVDVPGHGDQIGEHGIAHGRRDLGIR